MLSDDGYVNPPAVDVDARALLPLSLVTEAPVAWYLKRAPARREPQACLVSREAERVDLETLWSREGENSSAEQSTGVVSQLYCCRSFKQRDLVLQGKSQPALDFLFVFPLLLSSSICVNHSCAFHCYMAILMRNN